MTIKTGNANVDFTNKLVELENSDYPYDFTVLSWTLWDNSPLDADVPFAVKAWNEKYAYPKVSISGGHEIMSMREEKYGNGYFRIRFLWKRMWITAFWRNSLS